MAMEFWSQQVNQPIQQLDDDDVDIIQSILDDSDDDFDDDVVLFETNQDFPRPRKAT